ncbi:hypothetical protein [Rappaport israeli]|uniref:hypothetical protein n=1 Tax=Rappaport israeli TaxID=1839807 RepID=UPI00093018BF|nr:hypothetical protein [Rappaport israeli]
MVIVTQKNNQELLNKLNDGIAKLKVEGKIDEILNYSRRIEKVLRRWLALPYYLYCLRLAVLYYFFTSPTISFRKNINGNGGEIILACFEMRRRAFGYAVFLWAKSIILLVSG